MPSIKIRIEPFIGVPFIVEIFDVDGDNKEELDKWVRHNLSDVKRYAKLDSVVTNGEELP